MLRKKPYQPVQIDIPLDTFRNFSLESILLPNVVGYLNRGEIAQFIQKVEQLEQHLPSPEYLLQLAYQGNLDAQIVVILNIARNLGLLLKKNLRNLNMQQIDYKIREQQAAVRRIVYSELDKIKFFCPDQRAAALLLARLRIAYSIHVIVSVEDSLRCILNYDLPILHNSLKTNTVPCIRNLPCLFFLGMKNPDLSGVDFSYSNLAGAILVGANFSSCKIHNAVICADCTQAVFSGSEILNTQFMFCNLQRCNFIEAYLKEVKIVGSDLSFAAFRGSYLENLVLDECCSSSHLDFNLAAGNEVAIRCRFADILCEFF